MTSLIKFSELKNNKSLRKNVDCQITIKVVVPRYKNKKEDGLHRSAANIHIFPRCTGPEKH